ncbi:MAG TPA: hybrid sensor histidine kinase/response regulator [Chloroflexi bacterium]|nr:hybrid sensor histidine kinase/response regulator [Chloroflexota bacterium]
MDEGQTDTLTGDILVIDDTAHVRLLLSQMLVAQGHEVRVAESGAQALEMTVAAVPDLILLDIMMPEMDGYEVCRRLKENPLTGNIPIIFISALDQTADKIKAFTVGGVDYVTKPFQPKEVLARVATHLSMRALQKQLAVQLEQLQARNEELDAFSRAVARDLKVPLTSIIGFADMLRTIHTTMDGEQVEESLRAIASNGRKMNKIIDDLLMLSGLRQTDQVEVRPLDTAVIVDKTLRSLSDLIAEYQAEVIRPDTWPAALGQPQWVEAVWQHYISDAIEYGGRPPRVELGAIVEDEDTVRFWVRDNGPGLKDEEQANLLGASRQRGDSSGSARERGLGLFVVRRIMETLGRKASVESTGEEGTVFSFTLKRVV